MQRKESMVGFKEVGDMIILLRLEINTLIKSERNLNLSRYKNLYL